MVYSHLADLKLPTILTDQVLFSWGVGKDVARKVRVLSSFFPEDVDFAMRKSLMVNQILWTSDFFHLLDSHQQETLSLWHPVVFLSRMQQTNVFRLSSCFLSKNQVISVIRRKISTISADVSLILITARIKPISQVRPFSLCWILLWCKCLIFHLIVLFI